MDNPFDLESEVLEENKFFLGLQHLADGEIDGNDVTIDLCNNGILVSIEGMDDKAILDFNTLTGLGYKRLKEAQEESVDE